MADNKSGAEPLTAHADSQLVSAQRTRIPMPKAATPPPTQAVSPAQGAAPITTPNQQEVKSNG